MLNVDGMQLAKPLSVRTLRGLVLPSRRIILDIVVHLSDCCDGRMAAYSQPILLLSYLVLLLLVITLPIRYLLHSFSWMPLFSSHTHAGRKYQAVAHSKKSHDP